MAVDYSRLRALASGVPIPDATALTSKDSGAVNSGDATTDGVITNNRTRIEEIETKLQELGVLP